MANNGWIKLHRQMLEWEWADEPATVALFVHLLLMANSDEKCRYRGIVLKAGQLITSLSRLSEATGLTKKELRTRLEWLISTGEISVVSCKKYSIITVEHYAIYQPRANERAHKGHTKGTQKGTQKAHLTCCKKEQLQSYSSIEGHTKIEEKGTQKGTIQEYNNIYINNIIDNIEEKKINKKRESEEVFEEFRKAYKGKKRGLTTEFENFKKKYPKSWKEVLPLLMPALQREDEHRKAAKAAGEFVPQWAMLQTWINQSRWEMEYPEEEKQQVQPTAPAANEYGGDFGGVDY